MTSPPPSVTAGYRNPLYRGAAGSLTQPVQSGRVGSSQDSFVTAVSHATFTSSQGNFGSSQDSGHSSPNKSRMAQSIKSNKAHLIRGCPNYKVAKTSMTAEKNSKILSEKVLSQAGATSTSVGFVASQSSAMSNTSGSSKYVYSARDVDTVNNNNRQGLPPAGLVAAETSQRSNGAKEQQEG